MNLFMNYVNIAILKINENDVVIMKKKINTNRGIFSCNPTSDVIPLFKSIIRFTVFDYPTQTK